MRPDLAYSDLVFSWLLNGASRNAAVDGSSTPVTFEYVNSSSVNDEVITAMHYVLTDSGTFDVGKFAAHTALTNGIEWQVIRADGTTVKHDLTGGFPIKTNEELIAVARDFQEIAFGVVEEVIVGQLDLRIGDTPIVLRPGERIRMTINDDLSGLGLFYMKVRGYVR